jgi:hypothetical protein
MSATLSTLPVRGLWYGFTTSMRRQHPERKVDKLDAQAAQLAHKRCGGVGPVPKTEKMIYVPFALRGNIATVLSVFMESLFFHVISRDFSSYLFT